MYVHACISFNDCVQWLNELNQTFQRTFIVIMKWQLENDFFRNFSWQLKSRSFFIDPFRLPEIGKSFVDETFLKLKHFTAASNNWKSPKFWKAKTLSSSRQLQSFQPASGYLISWADITAMTIRLWADSALMTIRLRSDVLSIQASLILPTDAVFSWPLINLSNELIKK
jgi:hypothetical protein